MANEYRLQHISEIQKQLELERTKRKELSAKYHKILKAVNFTETVLAVSFLGTSVAGVVFLSTIIAAPAATITEAVSLVAGLLFVTGGIASKYLKTKAEKHEKIKILAEKKLSVISSLVSSALNDEMISDEEYSFILSEFNKFSEKKEHIRSDAKKRIAKQSLIHKIKNALKMR